MKAARALTAISVTCLVGAGITGITGITGCKKITADSLPSPGKASAPDAGAELRRCDRRKIVKDLESMNRTGHHDGVIKLASMFFQRCGKYPRLRWTTYTAYKRLGKWDAAAAEVTKLIAHRPNDKDYRWWRGLAYEKAGKLDKAAADYRQALLLQPKLRNIPFNLATVLEKQGQPCRALRPLRQYLYFNPQHRKSDSVRRRMARLRRAGGCAEATGRGKQLIRYTKKLPGFVATVKVGKGRSRLAVDDRATYVVISEDVAERAGIVAAGERITITSNSGVYHGRLGVAPVLSLGRLEAKGVEVLIADAVPAEVDGLLGLSFIARFSMQHVPGKRIVLSPRPRFSFGS